MTLIVQSLCFGYWNSQKTHCHGTRFHGNHYRGTRYHGTLFHSHWTRYSSYPHPHGGNVSSSGCYGARREGLGYCHFLRMPGQVRPPPRNCPSDAMSPLNCSWLPRSVPQGRRTGTVWNLSPRTSDWVWRSEARCNQINPSSWWGFKWEFWWAHGLLWE